MSADVVTLERPRATALALAVKSRKVLWSTTMPEERRLALLESYCVKLCGGNRKAGLALAQEAIWS